MMETVPQIALEVLASIPFTFGFRPQESVVITVIRVEPGRLTIGASARLDLAAFEHPAAIAAVDQALAGLARDGAPAALVSVHTDRVVGPWVLDLLDLVTARWPFPEHGGYHVLSRGKVHTFSPAGESYGVLDELELLTTQVAMSQPARSFLTGPDDFRFRRTPHGVASARLAARLDAIRRPGDAHGASWAECTALWWQSVGRGHARGTGAQALLLHALDHIPFRDGALAAAIGGCPGAAEDLTTVRPDVAWSPPDRALLERVYGVLASVARFAPPGRAISPLAMAAYLAWWSGDGARARVLCEQAREEDRGNSLAGLVRVALARACPPPWFSAAHEPDNWAQHG